MFKASSDMNVLSGLLQSLKAHSSRQTAALHAAERWRDEKRKEKKRTAKTAVQSNSKNTGWPVFTSASDLSYYRCNDLGVLSVV